MLQIGSKLVDGKKNRPTNKGTFDVHFQRDAKKNWSLIEINRFCLWLKKKIIEVRANKFDDVSITFNFICGGFEIEI